MMNPIHSTMQARLTEQADAQDQRSFNDKVLDFLREQQPQGDLNTLFAMLKQLEPGGNPSISELANALTYADGMLREDQRTEMQDYAHSTLDMLTNQALGTSYFYQSMLNDIFFPPDENKITPEEL